MDEINWPPEEIGGGHSTVTAWPDSCAEFVGGTNLLAPKTRSSFAGVLRIENTEWPVPFVSDTGRCGVADGREGQPEEALRTSAGRS